MVVFIFCGVINMRRKVCITDTDKTIGKRIKLRRIMLQMSQSDLARLCGISFQQIQKYESGANRISCSRLFRISYALNVPIEFFFDDINKMYKTETLELVILYWALPKDVRQNLVLNIMKQLG